MSENIVCKTAVVANITEISTKQLCEFSDKQILRLSGRPQPFLEYSPETLYELVESIKEHGIINPVTVLLLVSNVLFLKLIYSALSSMPDGVMILPWTVLIVGIARVARKADNLLSKIGLNPSFTGDPLGNGTGRAVAFMAARSILSSATHSAAQQGAQPNGKGKSEFKANNTGNTHNRSNASSRNTAHNSSRANARVNSNVNAASNIGFNSSVRNSSSVNSADFGKATVTGTNSNRFEGNKTPGQKGDARVDNKNTASGRNAANTARNTAAVGGKKNNTGTQKYSGKYTGNQKFGTQKRCKNTAWKPDKSFSHNPVGRRFGQTDTPPETKPEKAVENEPKQ